MALAMPASNDSKSDGAPVPLRDASVELGGFYVPQYEIRVAGAGLPRDVLRDVGEVVYKDKIDEIDSCELTVNNWDAARAAFKYIGAEQLDDDGKPKNPADPNAKNWTLFDPCAKSVEIWLGYVGKLEQLMIGNFTTMEPSFSSGPPVLQVRILNQLHRLRRKRYDGQWHDKKDSEIAEEIGKARDKELNNQPRFPWPIRTDANAKAAEKPIFYVGQKNEFDIDFLWKRAHLNGYVVQAEPIPGETDKQRIYFGPSLDPAAQVTYLLEWGKSLIDFKPTLTTANQFKSVTVRGWDRKAQKAIEEKVDFTDPKLKTLNKNLHHMIEQCDPREEFVVEKPVYTRDEARNLARSLLLEQHKHMVKATGTTVGLPKLRAGSKVVIGGVGSRLSGTYFVTSTTHTIGSNGYTTRFEARREDTQSGVMA